MKLFTMNDKYFVQYHCSATIVFEIHFSWLFLCKAYLKVRFEVQKVQLPFFMPIPTIKY